jgi:Tol biopolymer transport system component
MAQPFDVGKLALTGDPVQIAEHIGSQANAAFFSASPSGVLAYRTARQGQFQLTWFDRQGKSLGVFGEPNSDQQPLLSPDGTRGTVKDSPLDTRTPGDLWTLDFARGTRTRFTFRRTPVSPGIWSPDGSRIAFSAGNGYDTIYEKASTGAGKERELLKKAGEFKGATSWSRDGRFLLYFALNGSRYELWVLPLEGDRKPIQLLSSKFNESLGVFSPDGRWIAYVSDESGRDEIYVRPFLASGPSGAPSLGEGKWQASKDGAAGALARWRADGKEIIFTGPNNSPMAVEVSANGTAFEAGIPKQLFALPPGSDSWDVTADGKKFLVPVPPGAHGARTPITVVLNWQADLKEMRGR